MCGRFTQYHSADQIVERFNAEHGSANLPPLFEILPVYNIAPSEPIAVITRHDDYRLLEMFKWGLVPSWANDVSIGNRTINARAETLAEKPMFRTALARRRCLIPADGFFEWKVFDTGGKKPEKQPMYIHRPDGDLFAFAGLWDIWHHPDGSPLLSCTIVTVDAVPKITDIHGRMPAILRPELESAWLDPAISTADLMDVLKTPYPENLLEAYPVSRLVNTPVNKGPECIAPAPQEASSLRGSTLDLFE
jgi:putative SOS response-associated peptidase YedK